jgi:hypothetical protein
MDLVIVVFMVLVACIVVLALQDWFRRKDD